MAIRVLSEIRCLNYELYELYELFCAVPRMAIRVISKIRCLNYELYEFYEFICAVLRMVILLISEIRSFKIYHCIVSLSSESSAGPVKVAGVERFC